MQFKVDKPAQQVAAIKSELDESITTTANEIQDGALLKEWLYLHDESPQDMFYVKNIYSEKLHWEIYIRETSESNHTIIMFTANALKACVSV